MKYTNELIGNQRNKVKVYEDDLRDIYNSRTYCLYEDIEKIRQNGLAKGGSLDNAVVVKGKEILNPDGLRNKKEFVNHKILDCIGDLYTSGYRIVASVKCFFPLVSFQIKKLSIVPNNKLFVFNSFLDFFTLSNIHLIFVAEK